MEDTELRRELELAGLERCAAGDAELERLRREGRGEGWMWEAEK